MYISNNFITKLLLFIKWLAQTHFPVMTRVYSENTTCGITGKVRQKHCFSASCMQTSSKLNVSRCVINSTFTPEHPKQSHETQMCWTCSQSLTDTSQCWLHAAQTKESSLHFPDFRNLVLHLKNRFFLKPPPNPPFSHSLSNPNTFNHKPKFWQCKPRAFEDDNTVLDYCVKYFLHSSGYANNRHFCYWVLLISMILLFFPLSRRKITDLTPEQNVVTVQLQQKVQLSSFQAWHP